MNRFQSTMLNFLAGDGAATVTFEPALNSSQYDELLEIVTGDYETAKELCDRIREAAIAWGIHCQIDGCP